MLEYIKLHNFAIIDSLELEFDSRFNTITGETGAGKSIIIDAISIACGDRCGTGVIGQYGDISKIEVCFNIDKFQYLYEFIGDYAKSGKIKINREIHRNGRTVFKINDETANAQTVKSVCAYLLDIYGQHEHQRLFSPAYHLELIDNLTENISVIKKEYNLLYTDYTETEKNLEYLKNNQYEIKKKTDLYTYELKEIDEADLKIGEEEDLEKENEKLQNIEVISQHISQANELLSGEYGAENASGSIRKEIESALSYDSKLKDISDLAESINISISELSSLVSAYLEELKENDYDFDGVYDRLNIINSLKNKYSMSVEEILAYRNKISDELALYTSKNFNAESLEKEKNEKYNLLMKKAEELSSERRKAAAVFEKNIENHLKDLGMENCRFEVDFGLKDPGPAGIDDVEFLISPNPGMPVMSLRKTASGGELSRITLAIILNRLKEPVPLVIFDEIDAGIGGLTGERVGNKLKEVSEICQVISITHLPQIAAKSQKQFNVSKKGLNDETVVTVEDLGYNDRVRVIGDMFGNGESKTSLEHAEEILNNNGINNI